jgi:hypothetical protein
MIQINPVRQEILNQIPFKVWFPNKHIYKHCRFQKFNLFLSIRQFHCLHGNSGNGILFTKLFWPTLRKNYSSDQEKLLKFKAEALRIRKIFEITRSIYWNSEKGQYNFWNKMLFWLVPGGFQVHWNNQNPNWKKNNCDSETYRKKLEKLFNEMWSAESSLAMPRCHSISDTGIDFSE